MSPVVDVTRIMLRNDICKIERVLGRFLVVLVDGRCGTGPTVGDAFDNASKPTALRAA